jgi:hypothetical protein
MTSDLTTACAARLMIDRRRDGVLEEVAQFKFTDLAEVAAVALTERYHYATEVHYTSGSPRLRFEWGPVEREGVIRS